MDLQLNGRRALVTGGTKGIGQAIVDALAGEGAAVGFCARTEADVNAKVAELKGKGVRAFGSAFNVADGERLARWVGEAAEALGGVDIVVANISALAFEPVEDNWRASFEVDLMHSVRLVDAAMPFLEQSNAASIITISSVSGREVDFASGPYGTMKGALVHYTQGLAFHLAGKGIRANNVSPGNTYFEGGAWHNIQQNIPDLYESAMALNPTGRMGTPEEVGYAVAMLASPRASRISGTNLVVDGALTRGVQV